MRSALQPTLAVLLSFALVSCAKKEVWTVAIPSLANLPTDPERRAEYLQSTTTRRPKDTSKRNADKLYQAETAAASVAALLGLLFSTSPNAVLGMGTTFEETRVTPVFAPRKPLSQPFIGPPQPPTAGALDSVSPPSAEAPRR